MNSRPWMIGLLLIMALICSTALALIDMQTSPIIQRQQELAYMSTVLDVFKISYNAENPDDIIQTFRDRIVEDTIKGVDIFRDSGTGAIALPMGGGGFQGPIELVVALDGDTVTGFKIIKQDETPGLGARITEEDFQASFEGKKVENGITMTKSGNAGPQEFDAITGATETSKALTRILNDGFKKYFEAIKG